MGKDYQDRIEAESRRTPVSGHTREDVRQQTTLIAIEKIDEWMHSEKLQEKYPLRQHVFTMTRYALLEWQRKEGKYGRRYPTEDPDTLAVLIVDEEKIDEWLSRLDRWELQASLEGVVTQLEWLVIEAVVLDGLTYKEAAAKIGVSAKSVEKARARAKKKLSDFLQHRGGHFEPSFPYK